MSITMLLMVLLPWKVSPAWGIQIVDDSGRIIKLTSPAKRILALYGAYNEIIWAMGLENRLVGRTKADSLPPSILSKPSIGTHMRPNVEMILSLKPDLIIQSGGRRDAGIVVQQLQKHGFQVPVFSPVTFEGLFSVIRRLGILTGAKDGAKTLVASIQSRARAIKDRLRGIDHRPRVFFEVRYPNLLGAGEGSIINDIILQAGGINCLESKKKMVRIGMEPLIEKDPEAYIVQRGPMNKNPSHPSERKHFTILKAVREGRIKIVDEKVYSRPGPRSIEAVEELAKFLHPEKF